MNLNKKSFDALEVQNDKEKNWDNYIEPENLPKPNMTKKRNFAIPLAGGFITSILLAFIIAEIAFNLIYVIVLFEFLTALAIGFSLKYLIAVSNFTETRKLKCLLFGMVMLIFVLCQYFEYEMSLTGCTDEGLSFYKYIVLRFKQGLIINSINAGWIGLIGSWIVQIACTYYMGVIILISGISKHQLSRVPREVIDFALYHQVKGKSEKEVRIELSQKGWTEKENQDEIFEAITAMDTLADLNR